MARLRISPLDPAAALRDSIAALIRTGVPNCASITDPDCNPWLEGERSPAGHYLAPDAGWGLYFDDEPEKIQTPAILITIPDDAKFKSAAVRDQWSLQVIIELLVDRDYGETLLDAMIDRLLLVLTETLTLDDATRQIPQTRLSTSRIHLVGSRREDNFEETATGKIKDEDGHPSRALAFNVACFSLVPA